MILTSPCFNFEGVARPYIMSWINKNSVAQLEGAVLQYAVDTIGVWSTIGTVGSGINWYNDNAIATSPGGQKSGWSGTSSGWIQARQNLDTISGRNLVRFRFVYGSSSASASNDGFAIDDLFIGSRSKTILLEHFTNYLNSSANAANAKVDNVISSSFGDAVGIQYHTSFPGGDTLYTKNTTDPNARVIYYSVLNIPQCYLDGGFNSKYVYDFSSKIPSVADVTSRALTDADFSISITQSNSNGTASGLVTLQALKDIPYREMVLNIAVVEDVKVQSGNNVIYYNNVLKKLLPKASGTSIKQNWINGASKIFNYSWALQNVYSTSKLKIVAFVQDNTTKEVYQAFSVKANGVLNDIPVIQKIQDEPLEMKLYPNPARDITYVSFSREITSGYTAQVIDRFGRIVKEFKLYRGISEFEIPVSDLMSGLYFVRVSDKNGVVKTMKLIVE